MDDHGPLPPVIPPPTAHEEALTMRGIQADAAVQEIVIAEYRSRQAPNSRRHDSDLKVFADFLATIGVVMPVDADEIPILARQATAWAGVTAGLVTAFRTWFSPVR